MEVSSWDNLVESLFDWNGHCGVLIPGQDLPEWLGLIQHDYDDVDRMVTDHETIGG